MSKSEINKSSQIIGLDGKIVKPWNEKSMMQKLTWWYYQYTMSLNLSMLEPWERHSFTVIFASLILVITYRELLDIFNRSVVFIRLLFTKTRYV